ncbi:RNA-directed DNA polymerase, eukaryota, reverse transcriptase zinc-binding domain protein [Tanacetum coccineum]
MSPYLFTLVMEIFNLIMIKKIEDSQKFKYHFGCKEIRLTHLCFADDLLVVCNGDKDSLTVVKEALNDFSIVSGLFPNLSKSTIFFGSINEKEKKSLLEVLPFQCGRLPMKYLGVPLLAKRLGIKDCQSLVDRVVNKVNCWRNKFLSYAGRLQLIASVLASMHGKARIAWKDVCKPKENGGLGIRSLKEWNETLLVKQLWKLGMEEYAGFERQNKGICVIQGWEWGKISIWHDKWCEQGPLINIVSYRSIYDGRFKPNATVAELIEDGHWIWPNEWYDKYPVLNDIQCLSINVSMKDNVLWRNRSGVPVPYSTKAVWKDLRGVWPIKKMA